MATLASEQPRAIRENTGYYGKTAAAPNLSRAALHLACLLLASCALAPGDRADAHWRCTPLDPVRGELPARPCLRATLTDHNLVTVAWRVRNSRGLVYLADALGPNYDDPGYQRAECGGGPAAGCLYQRRVNSGGFHRWQLQVTAPSGEQLFATTALDVPAPFPPALTGGGVIDPLAPRPAAVTWQADPRNAPLSAKRGSAWIAVNGPASGRQSATERLPRTGPDARYTVDPGLRDDAGEVNIQVRDCRRIDGSRTQFCSDSAWAGFYTRGDRFAADDPLYIDGESSRTLAFTTRVGQERELDSATLLPHGPVRTRDGSITLAAQHLTPGEHALTLRSCAARHCAAAQTLRIVVDGAAAWETGRDYEQDFFPAVGHNLFGAGIPLDITWGSRGDIWLTREFSNSVTRIDAAQTMRAFEVPLARRTRLASANPERVKPFALNLGAAGRVASSGSALSEKVIEARGKIWFTQGGDRHAGEVQGGVNYSRVVSFDPAARDLPTTAQDDRFCVYAMPSAPDSDAGDNHVLGVAVTGERVWVTELRGLGPGRTAAISSFAPGAKPCANDVDYSRRRAQAMAYCAAGATADDGCVETWTVAHARPAMLEPDPADGSLWFTDAGGAYLGNIDPRRAEPVALFPLDPPGRMTWSIRTDADAVYLASYGTRVLYRFDKRTRDLHHIAIPSPATKAALLHSIDIDHRERRLWFTLTNEGVVPHQLDAATIGYVDLDSWRAHASGGPVRVRGVVYAGLERTPYPERRAPRHQSFHGIAVEPATGRIAIATMWRDQVTELTPRPRFYRPE